MPKALNNKRKNAHNARTSVQEKLKYAVDNGDAKIEQKTIGRRKGLRTVVTIGDKSYQYNPSKITKVLTSKLNKLTKTNQFEATHEIKRIYHDTRLKNALKSYAVKHKANIADGPSLFNSYSNAVVVSDIKLKGYRGLTYLKYEYNRLYDFLMGFPGMAITVVANVAFLTEEDGDDDEPSEWREVKSRRYELTNTTQLMDVMNNIAADIQIQIELKQFHKSGLRIHSIDQLTVMYTIFNPTRAGSYIVLPKWIASKKACINIKNEDNKCLKYSIQCGVFEIYKKDHPDRMYHYTKLIDNIINWQHMKYPCGSHEIDTLEHNNKGLLSINVFEEMEFNGEKGIVIYRRTRVRNAKYHVNLLRIVDADGNYHYVYIKDYNRLIGSQTNKGTNKLHHCPYCQHGFKHENTLNKHLERGCLAVDGQSVKLPPKGNKIEFKNHENKFKSPYVIYGDFECLTTKTGCYSKPVNPNEQDTSKPFTRKYQKHTPSGYKILVVDDKRNIVTKSIYRGEDCMEKFVLQLAVIQKDLIDSLKVNKPIDMTEQDKNDFKNATECYICNNWKGGFVNGDKCLCKVRDHDHVTGKYRGAAHSECNIKYNTKNIKIPVFFHNLKNYDAHLIISHAHLLGKKI